jgi:hypothetical protein
MSGIERKKEMQRWVRTRINCVRRYTGKGMEKT